MMQTEVIVIGAGIAGLTAAFYLTQLGYSVIVLEESERSGGRVYTQTCDHGAFEKGAQFFHQGYKHTLQLVSDAKLLHKKTTIPFTVGMYDSRILETNGLGSILYDTYDKSSNCIFRMDRLYWPLQPLLMPVRARKQCLSFVLQMFREHLSSYVDFHTACQYSERIDQITIRQWMEQYGFGDFYSQMVSPAIRALFFGDPDEMSALHVFSHLGYRLQPWKLWSLVGGASTLVEAISKQLVIFYKHKVQGIRKCYGIQSKHSLVSDDFKNTIIIEGIHEGKPFQFRAGFVICANYGDDTFNWLHDLGFRTERQNIIKYYGTQVASYCIQNHSKRFTLPYSGIFRDPTSQQQEVQPISSFVSSSPGRITIFAKHESHMDNILAFASKNEFKNNKILDANTYLWKRAIPAFLPRKIGLIRNLLDQITEWRRQTQCWVYVCGDWTQLGCVEGAIRSGRRVVDEIIGMREHSTMEKN